MNDASTRKINLADYYYGFVKDLSKQSKIDLILKLVSSLKEEGGQAEAEEKDALKNLPENYDSIFTPEDIIAEIKAFKEARKKDINSASSTF